jgi:hypothetical protein
MASTYVNDLRLNEMATGDGSGTWGTTTNTNLELIAEAFSYGTEAITTNADTHTTTIADGATDPGRSMYLKYTGTLDSACTITIGPNTVSKVWIIENGTSGSQDIIISQGSGANITIPAGDTKVVYSDGAGAGAAFVDAFASLSVVDLKVQDDLTVTDDASIGGDATITGTLGVTGVFTGTSLDISGDIDVDGTTNLDVVDIDGAVDMATTLAVAGNVDFNGDLDVDGTTNLDVVDIDGAVDMASTLTVAGDANFDSNTLFVDVSANKVGIGTSSPDAPLEIDGGSTDNTVLHLTSGTATTYLKLSDSNTTNGGFIGYETEDMSFWANNTKHMTLTSAGNVGIGTAAPATPLHVTGTIGAFHSNNSNRTLMSNNGTVGSINVTYGLTGPYLPLTFLTGDAERMRIDNAGNVLVGTTFAYAKFGLIQATINEITAFFANNTATNAACVKILQDGAGSSGPALLVRQDGSGNAITVDSVTDGNTVFSVSYNGALAKASGSFKINHPLEAKTDTHHLVHSFVEGPQADNIYRGKVDLVAGSATANIDTVAGMTEGTFVALNREVQCFTTNESNWDAVKGSVSGNILTIESENSESTATISWLVIGERKDQHMYDTDWTDENGKVIVEPLKD